MALLLGSDRLEEQVAVGLQKLYILVDNSIGFVGVDVIVQSGTEDD